MCDTLQIDLSDGFAMLSISRPDKCRAVCRGLWSAMGRVFRAPPAGVSAGILAGPAGHFWLGRDRGEHMQSDATGTLRPSRGWPQALDKIQFGGLPVVSALFGAATPVHDADAVFRSNGPKEGAGSLVQARRIPGADRGIELMLTRWKDAIALWLSHSATPAIKALEPTTDMALKIAQIAQGPHGFMTQARSRTQGRPKADGFAPKAHAQPGPKPARRPKAAWPFVWKEPAPSFGS